VFDRLSIKDYFSTSNTVIFMCIKYYRDSVQGFSHDVQGASAADVMDLLLVTQYFDMLKDLGKW
jgi:hypothetical protein